MFSHILNSIISIVYFIKSWFAENSIMFKWITNNYLYNFSWEDSDVDQHFLNIDEKDTLLCITTGGDNILNYLQHNPKKIVSIDLNKHQNYLLKMKIALMRVCEQHEYLEIIGNPSEKSYALFCEKFEQIQIDQLLSVEDDCLAYWIENKHIMKNFIYSGASGFLAHHLVNFFALFFIPIYEIQLEENLEKQIEWYNKYESRIHTFINIMMFFKYPITQLQGVPKSQLEKQGDITVKTKQILKDLFTKSLLSENPFYYPYIFGEMTDTCCFPYMKKTNYENVKGRLDAIEIHTTTMNDFLSNNVGQDSVKFTKISLLDHLDWFETKDVVAEFQLLQKNVADDHKIIFRSFANPKHIDKSLFYLNYLYKDEINIDAEIPVDKVHMYTTISCVTIPQNLIFREIVPIKVETSFAKDMKTLYNMWLKPIHGENQNEQLESFYKDQCDNYDAYRQRFLHGKHEVMSVFPLIQNKTVLDIGGATGFNFEYIKDDLKIYKQITILDLCKSLLDVADARIQTNGWTNVKTCHKDVMTYESQSEHSKTEKYDIIMISYTLTMIPDWKLILDKIHELLEDDGYFVITDFTVDDNDSFWKKVFATDKVYPNREHVKYIRDLFRQEKYFKEDYGGFPYVPFFIKCKWFCGVYQK
jgi:S-adenosylmethionine:diacylglycerol 3-amino-3-carboxypropyl transferase/ubiquinone/menaquinone biosynthesis C-methylase UbiE